MCGAPAALSRASGEVLAARCYRATSAMARLVGLLGTPDLAEDEALWLEPCASVHTWGMRIPIACAFLDRDGQVLRVVDPLPPWRVAAPARGQRARAAVECRAGSLTGLPVGERLLRYAAQA